MHRLWFWLIKEMRKATPCKCHTAFLGYCLKQMLHICQKTGEQVELDPPMVWFHLSHFYMACGAAGAPVFQTAVQYRGSVLIPSVGAAELVSSTQRKVLKAATITQQQTQTQGPPEPQSRGWDQLPCHGEGISFNLPKCSQGTGTVQQEGNSATWTFHLFRRTEKEVFGW